jgi:ABC-2 type transport system ATP-binding protein
VVERVTGEGGLAVEVAGLRKSYGRKEVLHGIDLAVPAGSVVALLGPNGAGKTTTVRVLATLTAPDAGEVRVAGLDVVADRSRVRRAIRLTGQEVALDEELTGRENLRMLARIVGLGRRAAADAASDLLDRLDLADAGDRRVVTYSGGMRRRLDLAASLLGDPRIVFLDEPTTGLDPRSRLQLWDLVGDLVGGGVTVVLTTQYLEEADRLADRVAVIDGGRIVAEGTPAELKRRVAEQRLLLHLRDAEGLQRALDALDGAALDVDRAARTVAVATDGTAPHVRDLLDRIDPSRGEVARFEVRSASLDDVFLALTGHRTEQEEPTRA